MLGLVGLVSIGTRSGQVLHVAHDAEGFWLLVRVGSELREWKAVDCEVIGCF